MAAKRLKVGLAGLAGPGRGLFQALCDNPQVEVAAVADRDRSLVEKLTDRVTCDRYDDYRVLIVEGAAAGLDAVFVALPAYQAEEYLPLAAERRLPVMAVPPFARRIEAAADLLRHFRRADCLFAVARTWEVESGATTPNDLAAECGRLYWADGHATVPSSLGGLIPAASRQKACPTPTGLGWQGDSARAGGGVLLHGGYELVDAVVSAMGVPNTVMAAVAFAVPGGTPRTYDTEDAASVVFGYSDERSASLTCRRSPLENEWRLTLYGQRGSVRVTRGGPAGGSDEPDGVGGSLLFASAVGAFVGAVSSGSPRPGLHVEERLESMATIAAAYLSARTGQAESPYRYLEMAADGRR